MFCWRADDGPVLNAGWAAFVIFRVCVCVGEGGGGGSITSIPSSGSTYIRNMYVICLWHYVTC